MSKIDFEAKSDRELLVLVAQAANETKEQLKKLNGRITDNTTRIFKVKNRVSWIIGVGSGIAFVIGLAVALVAVF